LFDLLGVISISFSGVLTDADRCDDRRHKSNPLLQPVAERRYSIKDSSLQGLTSERKPKVG